MSVSLIPISNSLDKYSCDPVIVGPRYIPFVGDLSWGDLVTGRVRSRPLGSMAAISANTLLHYRHHHFHFSRSSPAVSSLASESIASRCSRSHVAGPCWCCWSMLASVLRVMLLVYAGIHSNSHVAGPCSHPHSMKHQGSEF